MTAKKFFIQTLALSLIILAILFFLLQLESFKTYWDISLISLFFFIIISIAMYFGGTSTAQSSDKNAFTRTIILSTFGKMMLSVVIIAIYYKIQQPKDGLFLVPFFISYVAFTIFETSFMLKIGKVKK